MFRGARFAHRGSPARGELLSYVLCACNQEQCHPSASSVSMEYIIFVLVFKQTCKFKPFEFQTQFLWDPQ